MQKVIVQFTIPGVANRNHDQVWEQMRAVVQSNPQGLIYHVAGKQGDNRVVVDVWESIDAYTKFEETLKPILGKMGVNETQPIVIPVDYEFGGVPTGMLIEKTRKNNFVAIRYNSDEKN